MGFLRRSNRIVSAREERRLNAASNTYLGGVRDQVQAQLGPGEFLLGGPVSNMQKMTAGGELWWVTNERIGVQRAFDTFWYGRSDVSAMEVELRGSVAVVSGTFTDGTSADASFMDQPDKMAAYLSKFIP
jgi:hypothetical protein